MRHIQGFFLRLKQAMFVLTTTACAVLQTTALSAAETDLPPDHHQSIFPQVSNRAIVIGVQSDISQRELDLLNQSVEHLTLAYGDLAITVRLLSKSELEASIQSGSVDFVFSDPAVFTTFEGHFGLRALASVFPQETSAADTVSAAALIVAESSPIRTLRDAAEKPLFVMDGYLPTLLKYDLMEQGYNIEKFFADVQPSVATVEEAVSQALSHPESSALIPACWLEKNRQARGAASVRVVEPRRESRFSCERTTRAYPGWTFSRTSETTLQQAESLQAILYSMPMTASGLDWTPAPDFRNLLHVLSSAQDPFYVQISTPGWKTVVMSYFPVIITTVAILLGLVVYGLLISTIAGRRTRELLRMRQQQEIAQRKFEAMERVSIVGQMSSVVAHELRQPITAIGNYASSVMRRHQRSALTDEALTWAMQRINAESERANAIIEHVRSYAKRKTSAKAVINLSDCIAKSLAGMQARVHFNGRVRSKIEQDLIAEADALEITLVVSNLYKNAVEACSGRSDAVIDIELTTDSEGICFSFADNGLRLESDDIELLSVPLRSSKTNGLGLGLSIVRRIVESHGGDTRFEAVNPRGLKVIIHFPEYKGEPTHDDKHEGTNPDPHR